MASGRGVCLTESPWEAQEMRIYMVKTHTSMARYYVSCSRLHRKGLEVESNLIQPTLSKGVEKERQEL